jgi:sugar phosphate isomerase/epimerase
MRTLAVSSYCVREHIGPTSMSFAGPDGVERVFGADWQRLVPMREIPARIRDEFGVDAIEAVAFQFAGLDDPEIDRFGEALTASGVTLLDVAIDAGDLLATDPDELAGHVAELRAWISRFAGIGSKFVRVNPGSPFNPGHGDLPPAHLVAALTELGAHANALGTRLLVENHGGPSSDPAWMNALLEAVGREHLGLLLDLGNFDALLGPVMAAMFAPLDAPIDPFANLDLTTLYDGIEALADRAELVHVKSHEVHADGTVGPVDLDRAFAILDAHGYAGPVTVEYEGEGGDPWSRTRTVLEHTTRLATPAA